MVHNRLREIRLERSLQQTELARAVSVSRQTIHAIETSKYVPSVELALRIAAYLELPVESLFNLDPWRSA